MGEWHRVERCARVLLDEAAEVPGRATVAGSTAMQGEAHCGWWHRHAGGVPLWPVAGGTDRATDKHATSPSAVYVWLGRSGRHDHDAHAMDIECAESYTGYTTAAVTGR